MNKYISTLLILILLTFKVSAESLVYITDQLDIPIRADQNFGENIIRLLPSGTELSLLQALKMDGLKFSLMTLLDGLNLFIYQMSLPRVKSLKNSQEVITLTNYYYPNLLVKRKS